jgi:hypothetical protein
MVIHAGAPMVTAQATEAAPDQEPAAAVTDTGGVKTPGGALLRSAIVPGWGQIYNGYTVKGVAMMLADATIIGLAIHADSKVRDLAVPGRDEQAEENLATWRRRREKRILLTIGLILYSMADAFVDAHLIDFRDNETRFGVELSNYEDGPVTEIMRQEGAVFGQSDAGAHVAQLCDASLPTELLSEWVRDKRVFTIEEAVHKLTAELADLYGLSDRGRLLPGAAADVVVFDLERLAPGPLRRVRDLPGDEERLVADRPSGIEHVLVNGVAITIDGESRVGTMEERPGQILRAGSA